MNVKNISIALTVLVIALLATLLIGPERPEGRDREPVQEGDRGARGGYRHGMRRFEGGEHRAHRRVQLPGRRSSGHEGARGSRGAALQRRRARPESESLRHGLRSGKGGGKMSADRMVNVRLYDPDNNVLYLRQLHSSSFS